MAAQAVEVRRRKTGMVAAGPSWAGKASQAERTNRPVCGWADWAKSEEETISE
jgi:hypothetical protein